MSTDVTMQELELETAELLPSRETLWSGYRHSPGYNFSSASARATQPRSACVNISGLNGDPAATRRADQPSSTATRRQHLILGGAARRAGEGRPCCP